MPTCFAQWYTRYLWIGADRLVTAYQAAPSFNRISRPSTLSFLTT